MDSHDLNESIAPEPPPPPSSATPPADLPGPPELPEGPATAGEWFRANGRILTILAILFVWLLASFGVDGLITIGLVVVGLGFVIFIHELGHFAVAKWCDVHVETFSIGFGPPLPGCKFVKGETTYMIALFPLGGYVKMVGEGSEGEEDDSDPRSFKNKAVWQRMLIISAGVFMNVVLGCVCFALVLQAHGMESPPAEVGQVDNGSPAWEAGLQDGMEIYKIGNAEDPYFEHLMAEVVLSQKGKEMDLIYGYPGEPKDKRVTTTIEPRSDNEGGRRVIGIRPPESLKLWPEKARKGSDRSSPTFLQSPAAKAGFEFGDEIIGSSDPAAKDHAVTELPVDPANPPQRSYFDFRKRMVQLKNEEVTVRVKRGDGTKDLTVAPAHTYTFGLRMKMGPVTALRNKCPARTAGVEVNDEIVKVEVEDADGKTKQWLWTADDKLPQGAGDAQILDPMRLPFELAQWADAKRAAAPDLWKTEKGRVVKLTVSRNPTHGPKDMVIEVPWDDTYRFDNEIPISFSSPMSLPALGLTYRVETTVVAVDPDGPAAKAKKADGEAFTWQKGDVIKSYCRWVPGKKSDDPPHPYERRSLKNLFLSPEKVWTDLPATAWPQAFWMFQHQMDVKKLDLRVERAAKDSAGAPTTERFEITVEAEPDKNWPMVDRGMRFMQETRLQKSRDLGEALTMGIKRSLSYIGQIYGQLRSLLTNDLSVKNIGGPIQIFDVAYGAADNDIYTLIYFLGIISVNLAVVNFLPIPVLDGGHMVFLIYEGLRGKPASEQVRVAATYVGLMLIGSLMLFVLFMDARKYFW